MVKPARRRNTAAMAYDLELADRLRELLAGEPDITQQRMFGGLAFLVNGHLAVAAGNRGGLMLRVDPEQAEALLVDRRATRFVMQGRELRGWLRVEVDASATDEELDGWVRHGVAYAGSLPVG